VRRVAAITAVICAALAVCSAGAQGQNGPQQRALVVWVVHPAGPQAPASAGYGGSSRSAPGYGEQTPSTLGQTASTYGTNAGSVGQSSDTALISREAAEKRRQEQEANGAPVPPSNYREQPASDFGQNASTTGTAASQYGQTPSETQQAASNYGTQASNYGTNASNFGKSTSTALTAPAGNTAAGGLVQIVAVKFAAANPGTKLQFRAMTLDSLAAALAESANAHAPDVIVFEDFPMTWRGPSEAVQRASGVGAGMIAAARASAGAPGPLSSRLCVILPRSRNPMALPFENFLQSEGAMVPARVR